MSDDDLTVHILRDLRAEIRSTNQRLDSVSQRLDQHIDSTDRRFDRLEQGIADLASRTATRDQLVELELRLATRTAEQTAATRDLYDLLNANLQLRDRVERCEHDITELKDRDI